MTTAARLRALLRPGGPARRYGPLVALAVVAAVFSVVAAVQPPSGLPLDPRSADASGTKALTLILERVGADVELLATPEDLDVDTLLVLVDNLDQAGADRVEAFTRGGGTTVVVDYSGLLAADLRPAGSVSGPLLQPTLSGGCDVPALAEVEGIRPGSAPLFVVPDGATGCFGEDDTAWLIIRDAGAGTLVTTGGPSFVANALIGEQDNAVLAAALLAPTPGTRVGILEPSFAPPGGDGTRSLGDLIPDRLVGAGLQLLIAFLVVVAWRARRHGKPVAEPQLVQLAGSEIVVATGNLFQRTGATERAVELLRSDLRRSLSHSLGLPPDLPAEEVAAIAAQRAGVAAADVVQALSGPVPAGEAALVEFAQLVESLRTAIRSPSSALTGATGASIQ